MIKLSTIFFVAIILIFNPFLVVKSRAQSSAPNQPPKDYYDSIANYLCLLKGDGSEKCDLAGGPTNSPGEPPPPGSHSATISGSPSLTADFINRVLTRYRSPASNTGSSWVSYSQSYGVDPAITLAIFVHESTAGTAINWVGNKASGSTTHNVGNIKCAGYATCYKGFRDYPSWAEGIRDLNRLLKEVYINRGLTTVEQIMNVYAPPGDGNNTAAYIDFINTMAEKWRRGEI